MKGQKGKRVKKGKSQKGTFYYFDNSRIPFTLSAQGVDMSSILIDARLDG